MLRIFHYSPWYTYVIAVLVVVHVENLSLFALIYLLPSPVRPHGCWESFIIRLDILNKTERLNTAALRIFHYSPWYTYSRQAAGMHLVENLSLFALIYLNDLLARARRGWESFIIRLDILTLFGFCRLGGLRIFHYSPWYTYAVEPRASNSVENLSLFALIYLLPLSSTGWLSWESFIIRLDILKLMYGEYADPLRIFHYSPWYT